MAGMAPHPVPADFSFAIEGVKFHPQPLVEQRLFVGFAPSHALPPRDPFGDAVHHITAVRGDADFSAIVGSLQRPDGGGHFHDVVGAARRPAAEFDAASFMLHDGPPASRPGIGRARAVAPDMDGPVLGLPECAVYG